MKTKKGRIMEVLLMLEEKVKTLVATIKDLKNQLSALRSEYDSLKIEVVDLKAENAKLAEGNAQLTFQLNTIESSILKETSHVQELTEERSMTRLVLDDLIKSIDLIVENENQP
jgi:FtsZ-binding cell division protein ZapB